MTAEYGIQRGTAARSTAQRLHDRGTLAAGVPKRINVGRAERVASAALGSALLTIAAGRHGVSRGLLTLLGGGLVYRGLTGHCPVYQSTGTTTAQREGRTRGAGLPRGPELDASQVQRSITIGRPPTEVIALWQQPQVQARIMAHFAEVMGDENGNLRWRVRGARDSALSFETTRVEERAGELVRWRSVGGGDLQSEWAIAARRAPGKYGSELTVQVRFDLPGGAWGKTLSKLLGVAPRLLVERALRNFKSLVEAGEIPSTFHNSSARAGARSNAQAPHALAAAH